VKKPNANYLRTRQALLETPCGLDVSARQRNDEVQTLFTQRAEERKANQCVIVVEDAKKLLDPARPLDITALCEQFHGKQPKFTDCARKMRTDLALIVPPDQFSDPDLNRCWSEVEFSVDWLATVEKELSELKPGLEVSAALSELTRCEYLKKAFDHVHDFLKPLIGHYQRLVAESAKTQNLLSRRLRPRRHVHAHSRGS
jgi:hypothetical protein